ncbi:MAG: surface antigen [Acidobacteria bacterium]|nr:surface antigen [Acidobacteriota bacterium]
MPKLWKFGTLLATGFLCLAFEAMAQQSQAPTIERIDIRGNRRVPKDTIRFYIQSREGDPFSAARLSRDLVALWNSRSFENIEIEERDGDTGKLITFVVKEKPMIRGIEYTGNKSFTESNILDSFKERKVGITVDSPFDPPKIRSAERALVDLLKQNGRPLGTVTTEVENIPPSAVRIRFIMDEGPKVRIGRIRFTGNRVFKDNDLKANLKLNKERGLFTMFKSNDAYHADKLEYDIETNLKAFYREHGYLQVQVGTPIVRIIEGPRGILPLARRTKQQFYIELPIDAGDQYRIGKLELENCGIFKCEAIVRSFGLNKGDIVNQKKIKDTLEELKKLYGNYGYLNWNYIPETNFNEKDKTYDLVLKLEPDEQFFVHRIAFTGNTKTRDKVIRREFVLEEGKIFSTQLLDVSILRVNQLGFFDKVEEKDYEVKPDDKTKKVSVEVKLKEKSQQSIGFSGGVSGVSGSFVSLNYQTNNFMGRGESLELSITGGTRTTDFIASFTEPYLLDTRWGAGLSFFSQRYRYDTYNVFGVTPVGDNEPTELFTQRTTGGTVSLSRRLGYTYWSISTSYSYQNISIENIAPGYETYALSQISGSVSSNTAAEALQGIRNSEITPTLSFNSTNSGFNPTRGSSINFSMGIAGGILGGDLNLIRPGIEIRHFLPDRWLSHGRNTIGLRLVGQYIQGYKGTSAPFYDRFYIGGETTVRGFDVRSISPLGISSTPAFDAQGNPIIDPRTGLPLVTKSIISLGGDTLALFNGEYRIPIIGPLSMSAFYDLGISRISNSASLGGYGKSLGIVNQNTSIQLIGFTNSTFRGSTGLEIQFILPVVSAPFRLIFAYNPQTLNETVYVGTTPYYLKEPRHEVKFTIGRSF